MTRFLYSLMFALALPLILIRLWLRSLKAPAYRRRVGERFGAISLARDFDRAGQTIWIHAVSVGETVAAAPLVRALQAQSAAIQIIITTMTPTGAERVSSLFGESVWHSYLPYDLPWFLRRFLKRVNPDILVIMETELWPNLIHCCHGAGVRTILANARLSAKSAAGYRRLSGLTAATLRKIDHIAAQAEDDAGRFVQLGAEARCVTVTGSLKFLVETDKVELPHSPAFQSVQSAKRPVVIAASTREGEEARLLPAFKRVLEQHGEVLFILVPRHPERFAEVAGLARQQGFSVQLRSADEPVAPATQLLLGDSMGEMLSYYSLADIAFVGGSLVDTGCQNVLEPAAMGLPVLVGPSQYNFATICRQLETAGGLCTVADGEALAVQLLELIDDPQRRQLRGMAGRVLVEDNQQALPRLMEIIGPLES